MEVRKLPPPAKILLWDKRLREKPCDPVVNFDAELILLAKVLESTCYQYNGCGLAAPQIGDFRRVALVHYPADTQPFVMVNPVIDEINSKGEQIDNESCLSLPGAHASGEICRNTAKVRRCRDIVYSYQDLTGARQEATASGMLARIICHETDHCAGWFFTDRIGDCSRAIVMRQYQNFVRHMEESSVAS